MAHGSQKKRDETRIGRLTGASRSLRDIFRKRMTIAARLAAFLAKPVKVSHRKPCEAGLGCLVVVARIPPI